jgi:hypothetical protein
MIALIGVSYIFNHISDTTLLSALIKDDFSFSLKLKGYLFNPLITKAFLKLIELSLEKP